MTTDFHAKTLMKFPCSMVYLVGESEITLLAVAHQKRRPFYWTSRLKPVRTFRAEFRVSGES